jgi:hypothetical protein
MKLSIIFSENCLIFNQENSYYLDKAHSVSSYFKITFYLKTKSQVFACIESINLIQTLVNVTK